MFSQFIYRLIGIAGIIAALLDGSTDERAGLCIIALIAFVFADLAEIQHEIKKLNNKLAE